ncbi:hypothetical protein ACIQFP_16150 [Nocardiopsis alba]|uniref:hypothetical protein n=1 Tax=Nocardiopsis alba TaxID=53437 RepID=UPI003809F6A0
MTNTLWPADRVAELAVLLRGFRPGKWTEADLSQGAVAQGWEWSAGELGPILHTGRPFGEGQLLPVDGHMDIHVTTEEYTGLHFPLGRVEGGVREQVEAFRKTGRALRERLGEPNVIGSDDPDDPLHGSAPGWGAPFLRWRDRANSLELRVSGEGDPVLSLLPTSPAEGRYRYEREHGAGLVGGFLGVSLTGDIAGMSIAGITRGDDWKGYARRLVDVLRTMPAELTALGFERSFGLHGDIPGEGGPWVFQLALGQDVELGLDEAAADIMKRSPEMPDPEELGWTEATEARHLQEEIAYLAPSYRYDEVNAVRLAMLVLETAEALGIASPEGLSLTDNGGRIPNPGGDGPHTDYRISDYGLAVTENP